MLPIAFSTLACPQWTIETIIERAVAMGYDGIEWRGGTQGHVPLVLTSAQRTALRDRMRDANLLSLAVTAYTGFTSNDAAERAANVENLKQQLDLAADIHAQYVRAFLGSLAPGQSLAATYPYIIECLSQAVPHARAVGVGIAVEPHDDTVRTHSVLPILEALSEPELGVVWDIANAWSEGELPDEGARNLENRISYVQLKDGRGQHAAWQLTNLGEGEVPLQRGIELLQQARYKGALSIEWEYTWHPELAPPEQALPQALAFVRERFKQTA